jgi:cytochrome c6
MGLIATSKACRAQPSPYPTNARRRQRTTRTARTARTTVALSGSGGDAASLARRSLCLSLSLSLSLSLFLPMYPALAASEETVQTFQNSCAGCHAGGGNIVKRDATLALSDLQKYGLDGPDQLYDIIYSGRGSMPGFGQGAHFLFLYISSRWCTDRRSRSRRRRAS